MSNEKNEQISIFTDSQAALRTRTNPKVTLILVWECRHEMRVLTNRNRLIIYSVEGTSLEMKKLISVLDTDHLFYAESDLVVSK